MTNTEHRCLERAAWLAAKSTLRVRVGATTDAYGSGVNRKHTHPALARFGYYAHSDIHAELDLALDQGFMGLCGRTVYVARLLRDGSWALARPCGPCMAVLVHCEVSRVVWTTGVDSCDSVRL